MHYSIFIVNFAYFNALFNTVAQSWCKNAKK